MTMAAVTMTQVIGMMRGICVIGKTNGGGCSMSRTRRVSNWIIYALHAKRMSQKDFVKGVDKFCMHGSCKWVL